MLREHGLSPRGGLLKLAKAHMKEDDAPSKSSSSKGWTKAFKLESSAREVDLPFSPDAKSALSKSAKVDLTSDPVHPEHLLLGLLYTALDSPEKAASTPGSLPSFASYVDPSLDLDGLTVLVQSAVDTGVFKDARDPKELVTGAGGTSTGSTPTLKELCIDLTEEARNGNIDPVIGRK
ncbi:hypothetical protein TrRE_jg2615, partial [Triparma retinervis]